VTFNSLTFLLFFGVVLLLHSLPFRWTVKKFNLLVASYLFYAAWNPPFVILLWVTSVIDWYVARCIARSDSAGPRRLLLTVSVVVNLGLLGFFKYGTFLLENFIWAAGVFGIVYQPPELSLVLPVGISFYTFMTLSYTIDVYRGRIASCPRLLDYLLYVTFFPHLVAGPIVYAADFLPQLTQPRQATTRQLGWGLWLMTLGLFEKVVLADGLLAPVADTVFGAPDRAGFTTAWVGTLAFAGQIFFDFAGYSTCAIGAALCLGFVLADNFRFPYASVGLSDFWRRWHISLSTWLREYLYISLGGNRKGRSRTAANLMTTMLLGGLWHGASWRFVVWGGLHGSYLIGEKALRRLFGKCTWVRARPVQALLALATFLLVCFTWVFFRAADFPSAWCLIGAMLGGGAGTLPLSRYAIGSVLVVTAGLLTGHWLLRDSSLEAAVRRLPAWVNGVGLAAMLLLLLILPGDSRAFIYFQF
jgi:D-alanyl-lipoteichoic acid acyltransferase DltB (MBOAT superfamily)